MEWGSTALVFGGLGATALVTSMFRLNRRLQLSKAKHRSLAGHARLSRTIASLLPFYEFGEARFFCSDDAPEQIAAQRRWSAGWSEPASLGRYWVSIILWSPITSVA